ncbi:MULTISPECIES: site-specific integrase [unclassified Streptomyces]|uniref:site-specific integrase n=1 Tax=unclassified Streptomyces TaxID=2593676 RepID=UPI002E15EDB4|nr:MULTISPECIES: site-specific integrase [unclassified Streptomyces]
MDDVPERDLATLVVPRWGRLVETGDRYEPYRLVDPGGLTVEAVAVYFQELLAAGKAPSTVRSYGMDVLRWWRFLQAVGISWDRATRVEARDFSRWIQLTVKPRRAKSAAQRLVWAANAPHPVTGKPSAGPGYAPTTVAHSETVLRRFYDIHRDAGTGPLLNPFPLDLFRRSGRPHAHHNPMDGWKPERVGRYRPSIPRRIRAPFPTSGSTRCSPRCHPTATGPWLRSGSPPEYAPRS